ncbi:MAG TPA: hypothetical protein VF190_11475, partial [Rhodothermales bacterium]
MRVSVPLFLLISFGIAAGAWSQTPGGGRPLAGVVWREPVTVDGAVRDLQYMREMGIGAVRTDPIRKRATLVAADALDLRVFQELPVALLPAARLLDTLSYAEETLTRLLRVARPHVSARDFGLARASDTSDSTACAYFASLADLARRATDGSVRVYYVTQFIEDDVCGHTVDYVLLDALGRDDSADMVARWKASHPDVPVGLASVGRFVPDDAARGLNVPGSPESQARYLENVLQRLLRPGESRADAGVFIYRWRDVRDNRPSPALDLEDPYRRSYGLFKADGEPRPAADVVSGMLGRGQHVFAFASGTTRNDEFLFSTLAGWAVLILLGIAYASSPRLRPMVPRYFAAHGFYREAVREGRDVLLTASIVLLSALSLAVAVIWYVILEGWRIRPEFLLLFRMTPRGVQEFLVTLLRSPVLFLLLVGSVYGVALTIWSAILAFLSRRRYALSPAQALMLAIWPRWAVVLLMLAAMVVATLPTHLDLAHPAYLVGAWILVTLVATARTLYDYAAVTRVPVGRLLVGALLNPLVLIVLFLLILWLRYQPEALFLWHAV